MKESVARKDDLVISILHKPANTVLRVAGRVEALDLDATKREALAVRGRRGDGLAVFTANYRQVWKLQCIALFFFFFFRVDYVMLVASYTETRNNCKCHARVTNKFLVASRMIPMAKMEKRVSEGWTSSRSRSTRVSYPYWWVFTMAFKLISPDSMAFLMGGAALQPRSVNMITCIACTMSQDDTPPQVHVRTRD